MTIQQFVDLTNARGRHPKWRAKCPVHKSRGLTLAIYDDGDSIGLHCHAGCKKDDILAAYGLTWKDLKPQREWMPPEQYREAMKKRAMRDEIDNLKHQQGLLICLEAIDKSKPAEVWKAARKRVEGRMAWVECHLHPERVIIESHRKTMSDWARMNPIEAEKHAMERIAAASIAGLLT